ncbi:acyl-coenzyme A:6-aminopenicillanic acid acyl-transferase-domain-containing protein [Aspergillus unguis]
MPPNASVPTLTLTGSPYKIGLAHGQQAKELIHKNIKTYTSFFEETAQLSWSEATSRAEVFVPTIEKLYPAILDEIRGIADGSGLGFADILALNVRSEIALTNYENTAPVPEITDGCTALAQLNATKSTLIVAQNWDWVEDLAEGMLVLDITPEKGLQRFYTLTEAGIVGKIGLNSAGLAICMNALRCGAFNSDKLPTHIMARYLLEHGTGFDSAVEMLREFGGACTVNMLLGDSTGKFGTAEVTPFGVSLLSPLSDSDRNEFDLKRGKGPSFIAHTNHVVTSPMDFPRGAIYDRPAPNSFSRLARVTELAKVDAERQVVADAESVYARLKDQKGDPYGICRGLPTSAKGMERMTTLATVVMEMDVEGKTAKGSVTFGRPCDDGLQRGDWIF